MRQQLEYLQAELLCARGGAASDEIQVELSFCILVLPIHQFMSEEFPKGNSLKLYCL